MNKEQIEELKQIRKDLEIPKDDFLKMSGLSLAYKEYTNPSMTEEDVFELIKESMNCYDIEINNNSERPPKTAEESFLTAISKIAFEKVYMGRTEDDDLFYSPIR